jgi:hypothetical protein
MEENLESDKKEEFIREYRKLVDKYGYDYDISFAVVKVEKPKETIINVSKRHK